MVEVMKTRGESFCKKMKVKNQSGDEEKYNKPLGECSIETTWPTRVPTATILTKMESEIKGRDQSFVIVFSMTQ